MVERVLEIWEILALSLNEIAILDEFLNFFEEQFYCLHDRLSL